MVEKSESINDLIMWKYSLKTDGQMEKNIAVYIVVYYFRCCFQCCCWWFIVEYVIISAYCCHRVLNSKHIDCTFSWFSEWAKMVCNCNAHLCNILFCALTPTVFKSIFFWLEFNLFFCFIVQKVVHRFVRNTCIFKACEVNEA